MLMAGVPGWHLTCENTKRLAVARWGAGCDSEPLSNSPLSNSLSPCLQEGMAATWLGVSAWCSHPNGRSPAGHATPESDGERRQRVTAIPAGRAGESATHQVSVYKMTILMATMRNPNVRTPAPDELSGSSVSEKSRARRATAAPIFTPARLPRRGKLGLASSGSGPWGRGCAPHPPLGQPGSR